MTIDIRFLGGCTYRANSGFRVSVSPSARSRKGGACRSRSRSARICMMTATWVGPKPLSATLASLGCIRDDVCRVDQTAFADKPYLGRLHSQSNLESGSPKLIRRRRRVDCGSPGSTEVVRDGIERASETLSCHCIGREISVSKQEKGGT
jgi:hypothetical protein